MISRRQFCRYLIATSIGATFYDIGSLYSRLSAADYFKIMEVGQKQWVLTGGGGNILLLENAGYPVLIDAGVGAIATELLQKITDRTGGRTCTLINTHHHADHIGGNYTIRHGFDSEVEIISQRNLLDRVAPTLDQSIRPGLLRVAENSGDSEQRIAEIKALRTKDFAPTRTFTDQLELSIGDTVCHLHHFGPGHTDNDAVVYLPQANILHMGDLVFHDLHPYIFAEHGANIFHWQESLHRALRLCDADTIVIPGHGNIGDRTALVQMNEYFKKMTEIVSEAIKSGRSREEVAKLKPEIFADRGFADVQYMCLTKLFDELSGTDRPD